jgi:lactoylglutathione lyase
MSANTAPPSTSMGSASRSRTAGPGWPPTLVLSLDGAALMLQEALESSQKMAAGGILGNGAALYFQCGDALAIYREAAAREIHALREPQVGNFAWEVFFADPDGYKINFSSPTDLPEETLLSEIEP